MPAIRTEGKRSPVPSYYRPQNIRNASGAAARRHVASDYPNEIEPLVSDATDDSNIKCQVRIEIGKPSRRNFMDILVGGDVVTVDENVKGHDTVWLEHLNFHISTYSNFFFYFIAVFRLPEWGAHDSLRSLSSGILQSLHSVDSQARKIPVCMPGLPLLREEQCPALRGKHTPQP